MQYCNHETGLKPAAIEGTAGIGMVGIGVAGMGVAGVAPVDRCLAGMGAAGR